MKKLFLSIPTVLFLITLTVSFSCNEENNELSPKGKVIFGLSLNKNSLLKSVVTDENPQISSIIISIINNSGDEIFTDKKYSLFKFGESYISESVSLKVGGYQLTKFLIADDDNNILYASPLEGSDKAYMVNYPLPIEFIVSKGQKDTIVPEVVSVNSSVPEEFGYVSFGFEIVEDNQRLVLQPDAETGKDARISSSLPDDNRGGITHSYVYAWTNSGNVQYIRSLMDFRILELFPAGTIIKKAKLYLYYFNYAPNEVHAGENEFYVRNIIEPWEEYSVTWNNQPATTEYNQVLVPKSTENTQDYEIDITALCQDAINKPDSSFGFIIQLKTEQIYRMVCIASSDNPDPTKHPKLVIEF